MKSQLELRWRIMSQEGIGDSPASARHVSSFPGSNNPPLSTQDYRCYRAVKFVFWSKDSSKK